MNREDVIKAMTCILTGNVPCETCAYGTPSEKRGYICKREAAIDVIDLLKGPFYTVSMKERGDDNMSIWSSIFLTREKADAFVKKVEERLRKYDMIDDMQIDIDCSEPDDELYLDWIDDRYGGMEGDA